MSHQTIAVICGLLTVCAPFLFIGIIDAIEAIFGLIDTISAKRKKVPNYIKAYDRKGRRIK